MGTSVAIRKPLTRIDLDAVRAVAGSGEIEKKYASLSEKQRRALGAPSGSERIVAGGRVRHYANGSIYWSERTGAHIARGEILAAYLKLRGPGGALGFPISDEVAGASPRTRLSRFEQGAIYWSATTGAFGLHGEIFLHYMQLGGDRGPFGLPTSNELATTNGRRSELQGATIYWSPRTGAFEVHGAIRDRYLALGGPGGLLGNPISDESDVLTAAGKPSGGKLSRFEGGTIYWSPGTGAFEVHGAIRDLYERSGGPLGELGYPITDESGVSGTPGLRYNDFEHGIIVWRSAFGARMITALELYLERVAAGKIDDGFLDSSAELYSYVTVEANGRALESHKRMPGSHAGSSYEYNKTYRITPVNHATTIRLKIDAMDWDRVSSDDDLGSLDRTFDIRSCFGLDGAPNGVYDNQPATRKGGDLPSLNSLKFFFRISPPSTIDPSRPFRQECWWKFDNFKSPELSRDLFAQTFTDVEVVSGTLQEILNPFDSLFYEVAYKGVAKKGNCFGMSLEAAYARVGRSIFAEPIFQYKARGDRVEISGDSDLPRSLREAINRKHGYQLGASAIDWTLSRLTNLEALHPLAVYERVDYCLRRGDWPLLSMVTVSGGFRGHTVLPYKCVPGAGSNPHKILVADPNVAWGTADDDPTYVEIRKDDTFRLVGDPSTYESTSIAGFLPSTFLFETPFHRLSTQPRTPFWEAMLALSFAVGTVLILAGDAETDQITADGSTFYRRTKGRGSKQIVPNAIDGMARLPLLDFDGPPTELYARRGATAGTLQLDLKATGKGAYRQGLRTATAGAVVESPVAQGGRDTVTLRADEAVPAVELTTNEAEKQATVGFAAATDGHERAPTRYTVAIGVVKGETARIQAEPDGGVAIQPTGKPRPLTVELATVEAGKLQKRTIEVAPESPGEAIAIRPEQTGRPLAGLNLERLAGLGGPVIQRRVERP